MAKIMGAIIGFWLFGGLFGAMLGYFVAGFFNSGLQANLRNGYDLHSQSGDIFFTTVFSLMGHIAKADGKVSQDEIDQAEICIVPELKHLGLIEQPQSFTLPVIEFFRKLPL